MPIGVKVQLPGDDHLVVISNLGPTTVTDANDPGGERHYEWTANGKRGRVKHRRRDGWARLLAIVFLDIAERGDAYPPRWVHESDGTECVAGHHPDDMQCLEGGGRVRGV